MDTALTFIIVTVATVAVSMIGAYIPYIRPLTDKQVHLLIALSAGLFLGILMFLLFPETIHECIHEQNMEATAVMGLVLGGFLVIMLVDVIMKSRHMETCSCECHEDQHHHELTSFSAFIGLGVHAFVDGLVLATGILAGFEWVTLGAMCIHKFVVLFSLSSTFVLSGTEKKKSLKYLLAFALITPVGAIISFLLLNGMSVDGMVGIPLALSAGTFMYVALCDMVPEAFHREKQDVLAFVMLAVGVCIAAGVFLIFGHAH